MGLVQHLATGQCLLIYFIGPPALGSAVVIALILRRLFGRNRITFRENGIVYRIAHARRSFDYGAIRSYRFDTLTWRNHKMSVIILKTSAEKTVVMGLPMHITQQEIRQILQKKIRRQG
ncbi:hypothetical protein [Desulfonema ishimotonii]|nr:hypothetical protein [Desulfonema ishimotonii]